jgi:hypothetical protein
MPLPDPSPIDARKAEKRQISQPGRSPGFVVATFFGGEKFGELCR